MSRCPSCGEYDVIWMDHDPESGDKVTDENEDDNPGHSYCTNCDYGVCQWC